MVKACRFDIVRVNLNPTVGSEINKTRPAIVISPDEMNLSKLSTIIIAPMSSVIKNNYPFRIGVKFSGKNGQILLDQIRTIDKSRIADVLGSLEDVNLQAKILKTLQIMFEA